MFFFFLMITIFWWNKLKMMVLRTWVMCFVLKVLRRMFVNASQEYQSLVKANRRRCYCSSEPLSLQPTEGQFSFFLGEYRFAGEMPEKPPRFSSKSLSHLMHTKSKNLHLLSLFHWLHNCISLAKPCMLTRMLRLHYSPEMCAQRRHSEINYA